MGTAAACTERERDRVSTVCPPPPPPTPPSPYTPLVTPPSPAAAVAAAAASFRSISIPAVAAGCLLALLRGPGKA